MEVYDKVGITSVALKEKVQELDSCQKEKERILAQIEDYRKKGILEEKQEEMRIKMNANLKHFEAVVSDLERLKKALKV